MSTKNLVHQGRGVQLLLWAAARVKVFFFFGCTLAAQLRHRFVRIDVKLCRSWLVASAEARALMLGSFFSPAATGSRIEGRDDKFLTCATALGTFQHCFWECPSNEHGFNLLDHSPLLLRLGWVTSRDDEVVLRHMIATVKRLWGLIHGKEDLRPCGVYAMVNEVPGDPLFYLSVWTILVVEKSEVL